MEKINPLFKWIALGVLALLLIVTLIVIILMGYIMFAPDSWPKPFYLAYQNPNNSSQGSVYRTPIPGSSSESTLPFLTPQSVPFEIKPGQGIMFDTGTKIVNLAEPSGRRYIRANIVLEFAPSDVSYYLSPSSAETTQGKTGTEATSAAAPQTYVEKFKAELEVKRPLIDDTIITLLSSKSFESIYTASGKEQLRKELQTLLNARMPEYRIIYIYFTEFTVQ